MVDLRRWDGRVWESLLSAIPERSPDVEIRMGWWYDTVPRQSGGATTVRLNLIKARDPARVALTDLERTIVFHRRRFILGTQPPSTFGCTYAGQSIRETRNPATHPDHLLPWTVYVFTNPRSVSSSITFLAPSTVNPPGLECIVFSIYL